MQLYAASDSLFWIYALIAVIFYLFQYIGSRSKKGKRDEEDFYFEEEPFFRKPQETKKTIPAEKVEKPQKQPKEIFEPGSSSKDSYLENNTSSTLQEVFKDETSFPQKKTVEKNQSEEPLIVLPEDKESLRTRRHSKKNILKFLYSKYTSHELLVILPAILSRRSGRNYGRN